MNNEYEELSKPKTYKRESTMLASWIIFSVDLIKYVLNIKLNLDKRR